MMAIGYSLRMCARHVDSTNLGQSNLVFRSKPIPEAEMSNRFIQRCDESNGGFSKGWPREAQVRIPEYHEGTE